MLHHSAKHTVIVGAGIVGVASAFRLLEKGHRVTLLDRAAFAAS